jgi:hypothetical protein
MYDYYPSNSIAQRKHQELINEAAQIALVRNLRRHNRKSNRNPLLVAISNLIAR